MSSIKAVWESCCSGGARHAQQVLLRRPATQEQPKLLKLTQDTHWSLTRSPKNWTVSLLLHSSMHCLRDLECRVERRRVRFEVAEMLAALSVDGSWECRTQGTLVSTGKTCTGASCCQSHGGAPHTTHHTPGWDS